MKNGKMTVAVIGCGSFARNFVSLFQAHPAVERVVVCDVLPERAAEYSQTFDCATVPSFEDALSDGDVDAIAIFVQRHLHGEMALRALQAGKHVYSAVPMGTTPEECAAIVREVQKTGLTYMMGETCIYYPCSMFCRQEYRRGTFGNFVYGESQYFHDISHFPPDFVADRPSSAVPPFFYPTHSTAMLLHALDTRATRVTALGYRDREENTPFARGENLWDNVFSNEFSLIELENGGIARVSECRRIAYKAPSSYISGFYGTRASYQFQNAQHLMTTLTPSGVELQDVSAEVNPYRMTEAREDTVAFRNTVANHGYQWNVFSPIQEREVARLPESFRGLHNGHMGSHHLLIDDFCTAVSRRALPTVHAWLAARFTVPGLVAHASALRGGVPMEIPDFGMPQ